MDTETTPPTAKKRVQLEHLRWYDFDSDMYAAAKFSTPNIYTEDGQTVYDCFLNGGIFKGKDEDGQRVSVPMEDVDQIYLKPYTGG